MAKTGHSFGAFRGRRLDNGAGRISSRATGQVRELPTKDRYRLNFSGHQRTSQPTKCRAGPAVAHYAIFLRDLGRSAQDSPR